MRVHGECTVRVKHFSSLVPVSSGTAFGFVSLSHPYYFTVNGIDYEYTIHGSKPDTRVRTHACIPYTFVLIFYIHIMCMFPMYNYGHSGDPV